MIKLNDKTLEMISGGVWNVRTLNYDAVMKIKKIGMVVLCVNNGNPDGGDILADGIISMAPANMFNRSDIRVINGVPCAHIPAIKFLTETTLPTPTKIGGRNVELVELRHGHMQ